MSRRAEGSLFVGRLGKNSRVRDLEDVFEPYGRMSRCEIKYGAEMAYAFVDYEDRRDAEDAIRYENGREVAGSAIIVEWAKGNPRRGGRDGRDSRDMRESSRGSRPPDGDNQTRPQKSDNLRSVSSGKGYDECYRCHKSGHWARDCPDDHHYGFRRPSARRSRSPRRSSNRSRSRSRSRGHIRSRSRSRSPRFSRDRGSRDRGSRDRASRDSKRRRTRSRTHSRSRSYDRKASRSRSRSRSKSRSRSRTPEDKATNGAKSRSPSKSPDRDKSASPV